MGGNKQQNKTDVCLLSVLILSFFSCKKLFLLLWILHLLKYPLHHLFMLRIKDCLWRTIEATTAGSPHPSRHHLPRILPPPKVQNATEIVTEIVTEIETEIEIGIVTEIETEIETGTDRETETRIGTKGETKTKRRKNTRGGQDPGQHRDQRANTPFPVPTGDPAGPGKTLPLKSQPFFISFNPPQKSQSECNSDAAHSSHRRLKRSF